MAKGGRGGKGGGGGFSRATVPISTYRNDDNAHVILERKGYSTEINGYTVNIQKNKTGYVGNVYGVILTKVYGTLGEAKTEVPKQFDKFISSPKGKNDIDHAKKVYEEMKKRGGKVNSKEYHEISIQATRDLHKK